MSGGVDSTMAAHILLERGFNVVGLTMKIWDGSVCIGKTVRPGCYGPGEADDLKSAQAAANKLGIPHVVIDLSAYYRDVVLEYFRSEYLCGRTPNPCVRCNEAVKLKALPEAARTQGISFDYFATGHYARVKTDSASGRSLLLRGTDLTKDQSYFLARLSQEQLAELVLPLGDLNKREVKHRARSLGWEDLTQRPESQDFIESGDYSALFKERDFRPGPIIDLQGRVLGEHRGIIHYTIGQRRGIGISGSAKAQYVVRIDPVTNAIVIGSQEELMASGLKIGGLNWIGWMAAPQKPKHAQVKIRLRHQAAAAVVAACSVSGEERVSITFERPQSAVTPGQTAVMYDGDLVLGAGTILP